MKQNIALILSYDGSDFLGWQKTKVGPSIEETLEKALETILQEKITLQAASRTDRGVHAFYQVVNFFTERTISLEKLSFSLNQMLPKSIRIVEVNFALESFHPTLDALKKTYLYQICSGPIQLPQNRLYSWHVPYELDLEKMREGAKYFLGKRDFSSLCNMRKNLNYADKIREVLTIEIFPLEKGRFQIEVSGDHFLYKMVRNIVGILVYVGRGKIDPERIEEILALGKREAALICAPAHGLFLKTIFYPKEKSFKL